jgi:transposase-like protein
VSDLALAKIRIDGGTQPRSKIDEAVIAEYASAMEAGAKFPPIAVFFDGVEHWLADGFHRYHAANAAHLTELEACIFNGTRRDAVLHSVGANTDHGLRRTNEDKRRAVRILLEDVEWASWSDSEIARRCGVSHVFVGDVRRGYRTRSDARGQKSILETVTSMDAPARTFTHHKTGKPATMRTENIGKRQFVDARGRKQTLREGQEFKETRIEQIQELASQGYVRAQIAESLNIGEQQVSKLAKEGNITLPDAALGSRRRIDNRKVIETAVLELDSAAASLRVLPISLDGISPSDALAWAEMLTAAMREFRSLERKLRNHHG